MSKFDAAKRSMLHATVVGFSLIALGASHAHAGGVGGDFINRLVPGLGTVLDEANAAAGKPFDHGAAAALNGVIPGAGVALEGAWALQGAMNGMRPPQNSGAPGQTMPPMGAPSGMPMGPGMNMPSGMGNFGNYCATPIGLFGPGPLASIGTACPVTVPGGLIWGQVIRPF